MLGFPFTVTLFRIFMKILAIDVICGEISPQFPDIGIRQGTF